jgi:putative addiction module component (TIGR02574 family)
MLLANLALLWQDGPMTRDTLKILLQLPPSERAEIAMALWESLDENQREAELSLTPEQAEELDRRLSEHLADPSSAIPWEEVRRRITGRA